jgi:hypothetical protein
MARQEGTAPKKNLHSSRQSSQQSIQTKKPRRQQQRAGQSTNGARTYGHFRQRRGRRRRRFLRLQASVRRPFPGAGLDGFGARTAAFNKMRKKSRRPIGEQQKEDQTSRLGEEEKVAGKKIMFDHCGVGFFLSLASAAHLPRCRCRGRMRAVVWCWWVMRWSRERESLWCWLAGDSLLHGV